MRFCAINKLQSFKHKNEEKEMHEQDKDKQSKKRERDNNDKQNDKNVRECEDRDSSTEGFECQEDKILEKDDNSCFRRAANKKEMRNCDEGDEVINCRDVSYCGYQKGGKSSLVEEQTNLYKHIKTPHEQENKLHKHEDNELNDSDLHKQCNDLHKKDDNLHKHKSLMDTEINEISTHKGERNNAKYTKDEDKMNIHTKETMNMTLDQDIKKTTLINTNTDKKEYEKTQCNRLDTIEKQTNQYKNNKPLSTAAPVIDRIKKRRFIRHLTHPLTSHMRAMTNEIDSTNLKNLCDLEDMREEKKSGAAVFQDKINKSEEQTKETEEEKTRETGEEKTKEEHTKEVTSKTLCLEHAEECVKEDSKKKLRSSFAINKYSNDLGDNHSSTRVTIEDDANLDNKPRAYIKCKGMRKSPGSTVKQREIVEYSADGRFCRFSEIIGHGSSKLVYLGFDLKEDIEIAWNIVKNNSEDDKSFDYLNENSKKTNFFEIELLKEINHNKIIKFHESWIKEEALIFITELMPNGTLRDWIKTNACTPERIRNWSSQVLEAIEYLHTNKIVHRDIKCDNIFVDLNPDDIKIGDLGVARKCNTKRFTFIGTPEFMAREIFEGEGYTEKVDVYAFGMVLLEIITSKYPYSECDTPHEVFKRVMQKVPPLSLLKVDDACLRRLILNCISPENERFSIEQIKQHHYYTQEYFNPVLSDIFKKTREYQKNLRRLSKNNLRNWASNSDTNNTMCYNPAETANYTLHKPTLFNTNLIDESIISTKCVLGVNAKRMPEWGCRECIEYFKTYSYVSFDVPADTSITFITLQDSVLYLQLYNKTEEKFFKFEYDVKKDTYGTITTEIIEEGVFLGKSKEFVFSFIEKEFDKIKRLISNRKDLPEILKVWLESDPLYVIEDIEKDEDKQNCCEPVCESVCESVRESICESVENKLLIEDSTFSFTNDTLIEDFVNKVALSNKRDKETAAGWIETLKEQEIEKVADLMILVDEDWSKLNLTVFSSRAMKNVLYGKDKHPIKEKDLEINDYEMFYNQKEDSICIKQFINNLCGVIKKDLSNRWINKLIKQDVRTMQELKCLTEDDWMRLDLSVYAYRVIKNVISKSGKIE